MDASAFIVLYGLALSAVSLVFFVRGLSEAALDAGAWPQVVKLAFSLSAAWLLVVVLAGATSLDISPGRALTYWLYAVIFVGPIVFHVGLQMLLYGGERSES